MHPFHFGLLTLIGAAGASLAGCASSPVPRGTAAEYERASVLVKQFDNKVFRQKVSPQWIEGGARFWYRNDLAEGKREFILVDAEKGTRTAAFDQARMAQALSQALKKEIPADKLPIDRLLFKPGAPLLLFACEGKKWEWDLVGNTLKETAAEPGPAGSLAPLERIRPGRATGAETSIQFENRRRTPVQIFYLDADGKRQSYGKLAPGERKSQHTFAGHVWVVVDDADRDIAGYEATEQPAEVLIEMNRGRRNRTAGTGDAPAPGRADGKSPDGKWQAFAKNNNLFLRDTATGKESALTSDGTAQNRYDAPFFWSPDSKRLVVLQTEPGDDRKVTLVESSPKDQLQPKTQVLDYPKPGDKIAVPRPRLFDVAARKAVAVPDNWPNPWSLEQLRWAADSSRFTFLYNQRGHQRLQVVAVDARTGVPATLVDEQSKTFIDYSGKLFYQPLDATKEILWASERDGWNHLYLYDAATGAVKNQVTKGEWVVRRVEKVDEAKRQIWFFAGGIRPGQDPYYLHFCRVNFDGSGLTILTEGDGTHEIDFSPDRRFLIDRWSRVDLAPVTELRSAEDGRLLAKLEEADWSALLATGWRPPERFTAKARDGKTDIYGTILRPVNFNPALKYPVIENIYAGPQAAYTPKGFTLQNRQRELAELGFIIVQMDGMGTSWRSKAFHDVCWKNLGDSGFPDRIAWIRAAAAKYPCMDLDRVGLYGGSAGGQNALRGLLAHGDFYKVGAADCGCHDNRMDKIWWNEQWMGWPIGPHYAEQSNVTQAGRLQGKLFLIVAELDTNVDPASTLQVVNALIKANKDFDFLMVPGAGHGVAESPYGNRRRTDFFVRNLLGVEPRAQAAPDSK